MAKVKYDVRDVEIGGSFEVPPTGLYPATLVECKSEKSKAGNPQLVCIWEISKGDFKGAKFWDYVGLGEETRWKLRQFLEAVGEVEPGDKKKAKGDFDTDAMEGAEGQIRIKHETYEGEKQGKIASVLPLGESSDEDEIDDDDDGVDDDYTYDDLVDMDLDDLKNVIEEEELDIRVTKKSKVATILEKVAEALELEPEDDEDGDDDEDELTAEEVEEMDLDELKELIEEEELEIKITSRSKAPRIAAKVIEELELSDEDDEDGDDDEDETDYSEMETADLKAELKERGLKATGKKTVLIARLEKDDEEDDNPFE